MSNNYKTKILNDKNPSIFGYDINNELYNNTDFNDVQLLMILGGEQPKKRDYEIYKLLQFITLNIKFKDEDVLASATSGVCGSPMSGTIISAIAGFSGTRKGTKKIDIIYNFFKKNKKWSILTYKNFFNNHPLTNQFHIIENEENVLRNNKINNNLLNNIKNKIKTINLNNTIKLLDTKDDFLISIESIIASIILDWNVNKDVALTFIAINRLYLVTVLAIEQKENGFNEYPFYHNDIEYKNKDEQHLTDNEGYYL